MLLLQTLYCALNCAASSSRPDFAFVLWLWAAGTSAPSDDGVCSNLPSRQSCMWWRVEGEVKQSVRSFKPFSFERWLGTTKQQLTDTWTSWRRPQGKIWTLLMRTAWLPLYWLLSTDILMPSSLYAAESKLYKLYIILKKCIRLLKSWNHSRILCTNICK